MANWPKAPPVRSGKLSNVGSAGDPAKAQILMFKKILLQTMGQKFFASFKKKFFENQ